MTLLEQREAPQQPDEPVTDAKPATPPPDKPSARRPRPGLASVGLALTLLAALLVGFVVYLFGLSRVQEQRVQNTMYKTLRDQLARGVAPVGPTKNGRPIAILSIPRLGLTKAVVVEGTRPADLMNGPGHRVDTPQPGQPGVSVIDGRRATAGGPFAGLHSLRPGDQISVTSGYGSAKYVVKKVGDDHNPPRLTDPNRLMLVTGNSSFIPTGSVIVGAVMTGNPLPAGALSYAAAPPLNEQNLAIDRAALLPLMLWSLALLAASALTTGAGTVWARWPAYLAGVPVIIAIVWNIYENAAQLLPNLY